MALDNVILLHSCRILIFKSGEVLTETIVSSYNPDDMLKSVYATIESYLGSNYNIDHKDWRQAFMYFMFGDYEVDLYFMVEIESA